MYGEYRNVGAALHRQCMQIRRARWMSAGISAVCHYSYTTPQTPVGICGVYVGEVCLHKLCAHFLVAHIAIMLCQHSHFIQCEQLNETRIYFFIMLTIINDGKHLQARAISFISASFSGMNVQIAK